MNLDANNPFLYFDKSYYINLDHRIDRKNEILSELSKYEIPAERISAVSITKEASAEMTKNNCAIWDYNFFNHLTKEQVDEKMRAQRSCTKSHIKIVELAKHNGFKNVLIFEDDATFYDDIDVKDILFKSLQELATVDWDIFSLGCNPVGAMYKVGNHLTKLTQYYVTHAVAINHTAYDKIINFPWERYIVIDQFCMGETHAGNLKSYSLRQPLLYQRKSYSDIESGYFWGDGTTKQLLRNSYNQYMTD